MKYINRISHTLVAVIVLLVMAACTPEAPQDKFSLSCGAALTLSEGEKRDVNVIAAADYTAVVDNHNVSLVKNGATLTLKGVKVGKSVLTVTAADGEVLTCTITVEKSSQQKNFLVISTPRVENWLDAALNTETTAGLQVTYEKGIDAAGMSHAAASTYGFYFVDTDQYMRLSAKGDFATKGVLTEGMLVMTAPDGTPQYFLCEKVEVVKVSDGKLWIVVSMPNRSDLRIVTESF